MLKIETVPVIFEKSEEYINSYLNKSFKFIHGEGLNSAVSEILNDRDLNLFLFSYLPQGKGVYLGETEYFDQPARVYIHYGLTVDFESSTRKAQLFLKQSYHQSPKLMNLDPKNDFDQGFELFGVFPPIKNYLSRVSHDGSASWPSLEKFLEEFNLAFSSDEEFKKRVYPLKFT